MTASGLLPKSSPENTTTAPSNCSPTEFSCLSVTHCIPAGQQCDFLRQCPDGSDESHCGACDFSVDMCGLEATRAQSQPRWTRLSTVLVSHNEARFPSFPREDSSHDERGFYAAFLRTDAVHLSVDVVETLRDKDNTETVRRRVLRVRDDLDQVTWKMQAVNVGNRRPGARFYFSAAENVSIDDIEYHHCHPEDTTDESVNCTFETKNGCGWYQENIADSGEWEVLSGKPLSAIPDHTTGHVTCNFEEGPCDWALDGWVVDTGYSFKVVPNDHTTGTSTGNFARLDKPSGHLVSADHDLSLAERRCFRFWHFFTGQREMALSVYQHVATPEESPELVWSINGEDRLPRQWLSGSVNIAVNTTASVRLELVGKNPPRNDSALAVDDLLFSGWECPRPGSCTFEDDLCNWRNVGGPKNLTWERWSGPTPDRSGPTADHTVGSRHGYFLLLDAESAKKNRLGVLESELLHYSPKSCLQFYYYVDPEGTQADLSVQYAWRGRAFRHVPVLAKEIFEGWQLFRSVQSDLPVTYNIQIIGYPGSDDASDIAIDDIEVFDGECIESFPQLDASKPRNSTPWDCDFDFDFCSWNQSDVTWLIRSGRTAILNGDGPHVDSKLRSPEGKYAYFSLKSSSPNNFLVSAPLQSSSRDYCVEFWYFFYSLSPVQLLMGLTNSVEAAGKHLAVHVQQQPQQDLVLAEIALDQMRVAPSGTCRHPAGSLCDFEGDGFCGFKVDSTGGGQWRMATGNKQYSDHTFGGSHGGHFLLLHLNEQKPKQRPPYITSLVLPEQSPTNARCLTLWYFIDGTGVGHLNVSVRAPGSTASDLQNMLFGVPSAGWRYGSATVMSASWHEVLLTAEVEHGGSVAVGLDDISLREGQCPEIGYCDFEGPDLCGWENADSDVQRMWVRNRGSAPNSSTGPLADHTLGTRDGTYVYLDGRTKRAEETYNGLLKSQSWIGGSPYCFSLWLHMGVTDVGSSSSALRVIVVYVNEYGKEKREPIIVVTGKQEKQWEQKKVTIDLVSSPFMEFRVLIAGKTGESEGGEIAIDDISISHGACHESLEMQFHCHDGITVVNVSQVCDFKEDCPINGDDEQLCGQCDFDADTCGWFGEDGAAGWNWTIAKDTEANSPLPRKDKSKGDAHGGYVYTAGRRHLTESGDLLRSPNNTYRLKRSGKDCTLLFWYFTSGRFIKLAVRKHILDHDITLWLLEKAGENVWVEGQATIGRSQTEFTLSFEAGSSMTSSATFAALDAISFENCALPTPSLEKCNRSHEFMCHKSSVCITRSQLCDHVDDCGDGWDEASDICQNYATCTYEPGADPCFWWSVRIDAKSQAVLTWKINTVPYLKFDQNTGPHSDHTMGGLGAGRVLLLKATERSHFNGTALYRSPNYVANHGGCSVTFHYFAHGKDVGGIVLFAQYQNYTEKSQWESLYVVEGPRGQSWIRASAVVYSDKPFCFVLEGSLGAGYASDIAIDDISLSPGCLLYNDTLPNPPPPPIPKCRLSQFECRDGGCIPSQQVCDFEQDCLDGSDEEMCGPCNFENGTCGWIDQSRGANVWQIMQAKDLVEPETDHSTLSEEGHLVALKTQRSSSHVALLLSPVLPPSSSRCLMSFWYFYKDNLAATKLTSAKDGAANSELLLNLTDGLTWTKQEVLVLTGEEDQRSFQIIVKTNMKANHSIISGIAIDEVELFYGSCKEAERPPKLHPHYPVHPLDCDFEEDDCAWRNSGASGASVWLRKLGNDHGHLQPSLPETDHTTHSVYGSFAYVDFVSNVTFEKLSEDNAILQSEFPLHVGTEGACLKFFFFAFGETFVPLILREKDAVTQASRVAWANVASKGPQWNYAHVRFDGDSAVYLSFESSKTQGGYTALDDIAVNVGSCPMPPLCDFEADDCGWRARNGSAQLQWERLAAEDVTGGQDHTFGFGSGHVLAVNTSKQGAEIGTTVTTFSEIQEARGSGCTRFWYQLSGGHKLFLGTSQGGTLRPEATFRESPLLRRGVWHSAQVNLNFITTLPFEYYLQVVLYSTGGVAAVDDIQFGPDVDHTFSESFGTYVVIQNNINTIDPPSALVSPLLTKCDDMCFSFWSYHVGTMPHMLNFFLRTDSGDNVIEYSATADVNGHQVSRGWSLKLEATPSAPQTTIAVDEISLIKCGKSPIRSYCESKGELSCKEPQGVCFTTSELCDWNPDCPDGSDELNCSSFPERCNFENGMCSWTEELVQGHSRWQVISSTNLPNYDGPTFDHTFRNSSGHFLFLEKNNLDKSHARLKSVHFERTTTQKCRLRYWYVVSGNAILMINLLDIQSNELHNIKELRANNTTHGWHKVDAALSCTNDFQVVLDGWPEGSIAIDDVSFTTDCLISQSSLVPTISPGNTCNSETEFTCKDNSCVLKELFCDFKSDCPFGSDEAQCPSSCTFEQDECGWGSPNLPNRVVWRSFTAMEATERIKNSPDSDVTKNSSSGSYLLFYVADDSNKIDRPIKMFSPTFQQSTPNCKISFYHWLTIPLLHVRLLVVADGFEEILLWERTSKQLAKSWVLESIGVGRRSGRFRLAFEIDSPSNGGGLHFAVDEIHFVDCGYPKNDEFSGVSCSKENAFKCKLRQFCVASENTCDLYDDCGDGSDEEECKNERLTFDDERTGVFAYEDPNRADGNNSLQFVRGRSLLRNNDDTGPLFDHTTFNSSGAYIEFGGAYHGFNKIATLHSLTVQPGTCRMSFHSYMFSRQVNLLSLYLRYYKNSSNSQKEIWRQEGPRGDFWERHHVDVTQQKDRQLVFVVRSGKGPKDVIALDDISFSKHCRFTTRSLPDNPTSSSTSTTATPKSGHCEQQEFSCLSDGLCLPYDHVCDFRKDCSDGSDERLCVQPSCDFEKANLCGWAVTNNASLVIPAAASRRFTSYFFDDEFTWKVIQANDKSDKANVAMRPRIDHSEGTQQGWYALANSAYGGMTDASLLYSPQPLSYTAGSCRLQAWYYCSDSCLLQLMLYASNLGVHERPLWTAFRTRPREWMQVKIPVGIIRGAHLAWRAWRGSSEKLVQALDDLNFVECEPPTQRGSSCPEDLFRCIKGSWCIERSRLCDQAWDCEDGSDETSVACSSVRSRCSFEDVHCEDWTNDVTPEARLLWSRRIAREAESKLPLTDHSTSSGQGAYIAVHNPWEQPMKETSCARLASYVISTNPKLTCHVRFWYNLPERGITLDVYRQTNLGTGGNAHVLTLPVTGQDIWERTDIDLGTHDQAFRVVIEAVYSVNVTQGVALDDITLTDGCRRAENELPGKVPANETNPIPGCGPDRIPCNDEGCYLPAQRCDFIANCKDATDENDCGASCNFEKDLCGWFSSLSEKDKWQRARDDTGDHTLGTMKGHYMRPDMSLQKDSSGGRAQLHSKIFRESGPECNFSFWLYSAEKINMSILNVYVKQARVAPKVENILSLAEKNMAQELWTPVTISLGRRVEFGVIVEAVWGTSGHSSFRLDDFLYQKCRPDHHASSCAESEWMCAHLAQCVFQFERCDGKRDCSDGSDEQDCVYGFGDCNFYEEDWTAACNWTVDIIGGQPSWKRANESHSEDTGPPSSHRGTPGTYFLLANSTELPLGSVAVARTPHFPASENKCHLRFWYFMKGSPSMEFLRVETQGAGSRLPMWQEVGPQGSLWAYAHVVVGHSEPFTVAFLAQRGGDALTDIAIDEVTFTPSCQEGGTADTRKHRSLCSRDEFLCADRRMCLPRSFVCDCENDCEDGSDETDCGMTCTSGGTTVSGKATGRPLSPGAWSVPTTPRSLCVFPGEFSCGSSNSSCIPGLLLCDGVPDCPNAEDEKQCDGRDTCPENYYYCRDPSSCLHQSKLCDGRADCSDGSDESICSACPDYFCRNGGSCKLERGTGAPQCACPDIFGGNRCDRQLTVGPTSPLQQTHIAGWSYGTPVIVVFVIAFVIVALVLWRRRVSTREETEPVTINNPTYGLQLDEGDTNTLAGNPLHSDC
nr:MAM and LDL-receptor class A domain-containing protein 2-like [Rhipicephalus microplus]